MPVYKKQTDKAQPGIVDELRAAGFRVLVLSGAGCGVPDLRVMRGGYALAVEVKTATTLLPDLRAMLTAAERTYFEFCPDKPPIIGYNAEQIIAEFEERYKLWQLE